MLDECARFSHDVLVPLNASGDRTGAKWSDGEVTVPSGFKEAFKAFGDGGWQGLAHPMQYGGQGLPKMLSSACMEIVHGANMSFALCPLLTDGAIEALLTAGSDALREEFIPPMLSGRWTGTMNLTEPQAGSDLAEIRSRAVRSADGAYRIVGQKIFITYGQHDMAENIVHLVLARTPNAPAGVKGISLFIVPKVLADGRRNDVYCASIEHKLGIHASPTAVLIYGDGHGDVGPGGAVGYLIGDEQHGLEYMFVMMNVARYAVGVEGLSQTERAYQKAVSYAKERMQSRLPDGSSTGPEPIINHPDVKRMLMTMRALAEGSRAMALVAAASHDIAEAHPDQHLAKHHKALYEFLVPIVKGFCTEVALEACSLGIQVHGGMGYIEETGAAQFYRDARILSIYEGTTAIQANDLVGRKTVKDHGAVALKISAEIQKTEDHLLQTGTEAALAVKRHLRTAREFFDGAVAHITANAKHDPMGVYAGAVPYLMLAGTLVAGWQLARSLIVAESLQSEVESSAFMKRKIATTRFYAENILVRASAHYESVKDGSTSAIALQTDDFENN